MGEAARIEFEDSCGNVFEDIGFDAATAATLSHKAELVGVLHRLFEARGLSQAAFGKLADIPQPRLSRLFNGKISEVSTEKLLDAITRLGGHVTIRIDVHPEREKAGRVDMELSG